MKNHLSQKNKSIANNGFNYCRTCYQHLAGFVGVSIVEAMENLGYLKKSDSVYLVTDKGWEWLLQFEIAKIDFNKRKSPLTRQCIDRSERKPHLAGQLGIALLDKMFLNGWFERVGSSRELTVTPKGRQSLNNVLGIYLN